MRVVIIPGYSIKNKEWAIEVQKRFPDSNIYEWEHWKDPSIKFSAAKEAKNIKNLIGEGGVNIIVKSIGTLVIAILLKEIKINKHILASFAGKIIFCGIPLNDISEDEKSEYGILSEIDSQSALIIQNSEDQHGSFQEIKEFISQINSDISVIEKLSDTHDYPYFEEFKRFLES